MRGPGGEECALEEAEDALAEVQAAAAKAAATEVELFGLGTEFKQHPFIF